MRSVPAREIKRRGITAVDEQLKKGPGYIIKNDEPSHVVLSGEQYEDLLEDHEEPLEEQVRASAERIDAVRSGQSRNLVPFAQEVSPLHSPAHSGRNDVWESSTLLDQRETTLSHLTSGASLIPRSTNRHNHEEECE